MALPPMHCLTCHPERNGVESKFYGTELIRVEWSKTAKRDLLTSFNSLPKVKLLFVCTKGLNQLALYNEKRILQKPSP